MLTTMHQVYCCAAREFVSLYARRLFHLVLIREAKFRLAIKCCSHSFGSFSSISVLDVRGIPPGRLTVFSLTFNLQLLIRRRIVASPFFTDTISLTCFTHKSGGGLLPESVGGRATVTLTFGVT